MSRYRQILQSATEFAVVVTDRGGIVTEWNVGAERIMGWSAEHITGESAERIFTLEDRERGQVRLEMEAALIYGRGIDERWHMKADGSRFWASGEMMPLREEDGSHIGFVKILRDRTEQHEAGRALAESREALVTSETKWRGLFENLREGFILGRVVRDESGRTVDWRYEEVNRAWHALTGVEDGTAVGRTIRGTFPGIEDEWVNEFADVVETGRPIHFTRQVGALGRWYDGVCQPAGDDRFTVIFFDVTNRVRTERRLADLEERRRLATDVGEVGIWELDVRSGELKVDARMRAMNGVTDGELDAAGAFEAVHVDDRERLDTELKNLALGGPDTMSIEYRVVGIEDAVVRTVHVHGIAVRDEDGTVTGLVGAARDVTDRIAAEEHRAVLSRELAHRLKNTLAIVQSIATQTLRVSPDMTTARRTLAERIGALSRAHDVLLAEHRDAASVADLVRAGTSLLDEGGRVRLSGPEILLGSRASLTLSLIVHELATNASKYGSLSAEGGHVDVNWTIAIEPETKRPDLVLEWREVGGPPVVEPTKKSFGTRLIEMGMSSAAEGASVLTYAPEGLRCRITGSLHDLQETDDPSGKR